MIGLFSLLTSEVLCGSHRGSKQYALHFGSTPIHFAVCSNNINIFEFIYNANLTYLKLHPYEVLFKADQYGYNAFHLCVLHSLQDMYTYIHKRAYQVVYDTVRDIYSEATLMASKQSSERDGLTGTSVLAVGTELDMSQSIFQTFATGKLS